MQSSLHCCQEPAAHTIGCMSIPTNNKIVLTQRIHFVIKKKGFQTPQPAAGTLPMSNIQTSQTRYWGYQLFIWSNFFTQSSDLFCYVPPSTRNCTGGFPSILQQNCDNPLISWQCSSSKLASILIIFSYLSTIGIVRFRDCYHNLIVC